MVCFDYRSVPARLPVNLLVNASTRSKTGEINLSYWWPLNGLLNARMRRKSARSTCTIADVKCVSKCSKRHFSAASVKCDTKASSHCDTKTTHTMRSELNIVLLPPFCLCKLASKRLLLLLLLLVRVKRSDTADSFGRNKGSRAFVIWIWKVEKLRKR